MENVISAQHKVRSSLWPSEVEARRKEFVHAEETYGRLVAEAEKQLGTTTDPVSYAERQRSLDLAIRDTMDKLDGVIETPGQNLSDVLIKLNLICDILTGTEQSPSEQLALSARDDLERLLNQ